MAVVTKSVLLLGYSKPALNKGLVLICFDLKDHMRPQSPSVPPQTKCTWFRNSKNFVQSLRQSESSEFSTLA